MKILIHPFLPLFIILCCSANLNGAREWNYYSSDNGLAGNSIWYIREDQKGHLWLITLFDGATRYDGEHFQILNASRGLVSNNIYSILPDSKGNLWLATDRGVSRFDGRQFHNFQVANGLAGNAVTFLLEDHNGNIWFITDGGISKYDGENFHTLQIPNGREALSVNCIFEDNNGTIWLGTEKGLLKYPGAKFSDFAEPINLLFENSKNNLWIAAENGLYRLQPDSISMDGPLLRMKITHIVEDRNGNLWFASSDNRLFKYDVLSKKFIQLTGFKGSSILSMIADSHGQLWIGTENSINEFDGKEFKIFIEINEKPLSYVRAIWEDMDTDIWFGTENGVYEYIVQNLRHFTTDDGLGDNKVRTVMEDKEGNLWFGTENGLTKFNDKGFQNFVLGDKQTDNHILSLYEDLKGNIWIGTISGIFRDLKSIEDENLKIASAIRDIKEDAWGNLWFATPEGVAKYDGNSLRSFPIEGGGKIFLDSQNNLWIGSWHSGIYKIQDGDTLIRFTMEDGLGSNHVTWILETSDGGFWFGLKGGFPEPASKLMPKSGVGYYNNIDFKNFSIENGLVSDIISAAVEDTMGNIWFGTDKGVLKYDPQGAVDSLALVSIAQADGLISNFVTSMFLDKSGKFWFGTDKGVSKYDGDNFQNIPLEGSIPFGVIESIFEDSKGNLWFLTTSDGVFRYTPPAKDIKPRIHLEQIEADKIYYDDIEEIKIPKTTHRITFEYKAISFKTDPEKMRYTYKLKGFDPDWNPSTNATRVHYADIEPGNYQFLVRAIDSDLRYSDPPVTVNFSVYQPFYRTNLFLIIIILIGFSFLGGATYLSRQLIQQRKIAAEYREKLRLQKEAERIQVGKMEALHQLVAGMAHEINNPIGAISSNIDIYLRAINKMNDTLAADESTIEKEKILRIIAMLKDLTASSRIASGKIAKIVANLRSFVRLDEAEWQTADINQCVDSVVNLIEPELIGKVTIEKKYGNLPQIYCSPRNLNQVFLSMFRNACDAIERRGKITIRTSVEEDHIKIEIIDDGKGIPKEHLHKIFDPGFTTKGVKVGVGLGLSICYQIIVEEHKGHIDVSSDLGKGSSFIITLPKSKEDS
jgi:ligand-binding sensor domain-containing protein/signal transduction histidine kinase